ncbi:3-isopropylmalate dehydratase small subunit [Streptomyces sp. NBC_00996]|uniref:3-isopropylmalate dehydratase small subunit n=1 Tax=Streptomyces sp. NBC_00996 TaxID=2903710 RepID=UPI003866F237|nr:3-isopropylmalate dehydratase small subunit [Streptomyces sp. NBC_00996]
MQPFRQISGVAAPLLRANIDTDALSPSRIRMKQLSKYGFEDALFANWRFDEGGAERPEFVLNQQPYRTASILVAGANFGCGSSRETAVWALRDFGFRAVIAPSFASIFETNCVRNGLLPLALPPDQHQQLVEETFAPERQPSVDIDLEACEVGAAGAGRHTFTIDERARRQLLNGLDAIGETLLLSDDIKRFRDRDRAARPWVYRPAHH